MVVDFDDLMVFSLTPCQVNDFINLFMHKMCWYLTNKLVVVVVVPKRLHMVRLSTFLLLSFDAGSRMSEIKNIV